MSFDKLGDYWDTYDYKEVIETIWGSYEDLAEEQKVAIEAVNYSKSIKTVPYEIKKKWKKIKFKIIDGQFHLMTDFEDVLTSIEVFEDNNYNVFDNNLKPLKLENQYGFEMEYKITVTDKPFNGEEPYNPIEFRDLNNNPLEVDIFNGYIEDDVLEIWVENYYVHNPLVYETFGELVGLNKGVFGLNKYSRKYYNMTVAMWYVLVNGPTIENIKMGLYLFYDLPMTMAQESTIEVWEPGHVKLSTGEEWYYKPDFKLIEHYEDEDYNKIPVNGVGDKVPPFNFLVQGIEVKDYLTHPGWWKPMNYFDSDIDIEKNSTAFIEVTGRAFGNQSRNLSILYDFLTRISPQYMTFELFLVTNTDDNDYGGGGEGGIGPGGGDPYDPGGDEDSGNYDDFEPENPDGGNGDNGNYDQGDGDDYGEGDDGAKHKIDNAQATDYEDERGKLHDPWFEKEAEAEIADRPVNWGPVPEFHHTYALQDRYYQFDGEIKYDNMGEQLVIEVHENDVLLKTLRNY